MADTINNVKTTFSSWDSCMSKAYCKWPVIAGIVIGSLIILSVVFCVARCICCGAECVCCCFKCCSGCCGSGGSRRDKGHQQLGSVPPTPYGASPHGGLPMYNQQYASAPAPMYGNRSVGGVGGGGGFGGGNVAQTATFEGKVHEDSLPAMPSWDSAQERRVEVVEEVKPNAGGAGEAHEMEKLSPTGARATSPLAGFAAPTQPQRAMGAGSAPHSPYGHDERDPFLQGGQTQGMMHGDGYRGATSPPLQQGGSAAIGYGFANHRPGGLQNQQPSYNSYQDSQSDFYAQGGGYHDDRSRGYQQGRPEHDRQYSQQTLPAYDDGRGYNHGNPTMPNHEDYRHDNRSPQYGQQQSRHDQGYHQPAELNAQYTGSTAYDPRQQGYDQNNGAYRAFTPANGHRPAQGSWKDI